MAGPGNCISDNTFQITVGTVRHRLIIIDANGITNIVLRDLISGLRRRRPVLQCGCEIALLIGTPPCCEVGLCRRAENKEQDGYNWQQRRRAKFLPQY